MILPYKPRDIIKLIKSTMTTNSVIIDIGAYRGGYTIIFSKIAKKGKVIDIKPNSENYRFLLLNIYFNKRNQISFKAKHHLN